MGVRGVRGVRIGGSKLSNEPGSQRYRGVSMRVSHDRGSHDTRENRFRLSNATGIVTIQLSNDTGGVTVRGSKGSNDTLE